jgi:hypothetical protein
MSGIDRLRQSILAGMRQNVYPSCPPSVSIFDSGWNAPRAVCGLAKCPFLSKLGLEAGAIDNTFSHDETEHRRPVV